ncbi:Yippee-like protein domain-containing protein [Rozella allomycis CSF55]|uniref:Protein yippee-like n=1 Tax=Rozella allomycis (strain CSF55) TaxID=988480 RepID=A0A075AVB8_ROZAC|nr:Yippee-like protein domain-containing protein [Rozella allomycis CSF55]|eukprot:EPZ34271.1 Yippee-like protein domain-containing protein [Rozella allomycis CSF55]
MGKVHKRYLDVSSCKVMACSNCRTHISTVDLIAFNGHHGRAFLFKSGVNLIFGDPEERSLMTGEHIVQAAFCTECETEIGWKYIRSPNESQKYKEGKIVLERNLLSEIESEESL